MNRSLLIKELRALRPLAVCIVAVFALGTLYLLFTEAPDDQRFDPSHWLEKSRSGSLVLLALFSLPLGAGLLIHESEQRTLLFLDGLPVSRTRIFCTKILAGFLVITLVPVLDLGGDIFFGWISRTSLDGPLPWRFFAVEFALLVLAAAYLIAASVLLSFTRAWFALVGGLLLWSYLWLRQRGWSWLAFVDPYEMLGPTLRGAHISIPWRHVATQAGVMAGCFCAAWLAFLSLGDRTQFVLERLGRLRWLATLATGLRWLAPIVWIAALGRIASSNEPQGQGADGSNSPVGEAAFSKRESKHYDFLLRRVQSDDATPLIRDADKIYDQVAAFLGAAPSPSRVVVDLASPVMSHASGQTNWTKIRIPLPPKPDAQFMKRVLGHETTHVFIEQASDGRLGSVFNSIRCLHEGLATHVELAVFGTDDDREMNRCSVAGAWARGPVPLELLIDNDKLSQTREPNLAYPLGEVLARALIEAHGREAPLRLLRAFARKGAPIGLRGAALWRDTMQAAGLDFDRVAAIYETDCAKNRAQEALFVAALPRLLATVKTEKDQIVVRPAFIGLPPGKILCVTESDDPLFPQLQVLKSHADGSFSWPRARVSKPVFRYLLGWRTARTYLPVFEPWAETSLEE